MATTAMVKAQAMAMDAQAVKVTGFGKAVRAFLRALDAKPKTKATYATALSVFGDWLKGQGYTLMPDSLQRFRDDCIAKGLSAFSVATYITAARRFLAFLSAQGLLPFAPPKVRTAKPRGFRKEALTEAEAMRLLSAIDRTTVEGKRDYALTLLLLACGLRCVEAVRANVGDIRTKDGRKVLYVHGKGRDGKDDFVVLPDAVVDALYDYLAARGKVTPNTPLFVSLSNRNKGKRLTVRAMEFIIDRYLQAAGLKRDGVSAHSLRHTAATLALKHGAPLLRVKEMLRHAKVETTLVYVRDLERVRQPAEDLVASALFNSPFGE